MVTILSDSPATVLAQYIISLGHMTSPSDEDNWPLYVSYLPEGDNIEDDAGAVYDTTPLKDGRLMDGTLIQHFGIQLSIRSREFNNGWDKISDISIALGEVIRETVTLGSNDYLIQSITRGGVNALGIDPETRKYLFSDNFLVTISQA